MKNKHWFLVSYGDNRKEILTAEEWSKQDKTCEDFDGFNPTSILATLTKEDLRNLKNYFTKIDLDIQKHTGHKTLGEWEAYEKGRRDEESVIIQWIKDWDGSTNSGLGDILNQKLGERRIKEIESEKACQKHVEI